MQSLLNIYSLCAFKIVDRYRAISTKYVYMSLNSITILNNTYRIKSFMEEMKQNPCREGIVSTNNKEDNL